MSTHYPLLAFSDLTIQRRFHEHAAALSVSPEDLYNALLADAEIQPPNWNLQGRQANIWKELSTPTLHEFSDQALSRNIDYIPQDTFAAGGANTKQASRTLEVGRSPELRLFMLRIFSTACFQRFFYIPSCKGAWKNRRCSEGVKWRPFTMLFPCSNRHVISVC